MSCERQSRTGSGGVSAAESRTHREPPRMPRIVALLFISTGNDNVCTTHGLGLDLDELDLRQADGCIPVNRALEDGFIPIPDARGMQATPVVLSHVT